MTTNVAEIAAVFTPLRILASKRSQVCPACGNPKRANNSLCGACYHQLPPMMQHALYRPVEQGYDRALMAALRQLGATTLHEDTPDLRRLVSVRLRRQALHVVTVRHSLYSAVCPRCAGAKVSGFAFCAGCVREVHRRFEQAARAPGLFGHITHIRDWRAFREGLNLAAFEQDAPAYTARLLEAFRLARSATFYAGDPPEEFCHG